MVEVEQAWDALLEVKATDPQVFALLLQPRSTWTVPQVTFPTDKVDPTAALCDCPLS